MAKKFFLANPWMLAFYIAWSSLPFYGSSVFDSALSSRSNPVQVTTFIGLWLLWSIVLAVSLIPSASLLTLFRVFVPISVVIAVLGSVESKLSISSVLLLLATSLCTAVSSLPSVGFWFVNGSSYGDEVRIPLRPPGPLLLGPLPLAWALIASTLLLAPLLIASGRIFLSVIVVLAGGGMSIFAFRSLSALAMRWLVFVPAGVVLHDNMVSADPFLLRKNAITEIRPADRDTSGRDFTFSSLGLALEVQLHEPAELSLHMNPRLPPETVLVESFLIAPSLISATLDEARKRSIHAH